MAEKHTFRIQAMGELGIFEGDVFNGIALEGSHEAIRSVARAFLEPVVVIPAGSHNKLVEALKAAEQQLDYGQVDAAHQIIMRALSSLQTQEG